MPVGLLGMVLMVRRSVPEMVPFPPKCRFRKSTPAMAPGFVLVLRKSVPATGPSLAGMFLRLTPAIEPGCVGISLKSTPDTGPADW